MSGRLAELLVSKLQTRFADRSMKLGGEGDSLVVFPAAHPEVGAVEIYGDEDELTVVLGRFTHTHFGNFDEGLTEPERSERIAHDVEEFLADLFADKIELYGSHLGGGGWRSVDEKPRGFVSRLILGGKTYVWSGPVGGATDDEDS